MPLWPPDLTGGFLAIGEPVLGGTPGDFLKVAPDGTLGQTPVAGVGIAIGETVLSGTPNAVLFVDAAGNLGQDPGHFDYVKALQQLSLFSPLVDTEAKAQITLRPGSDSARPVLFRNAAGVKVGYFNGDSSYHTNAYAVISGYFDPDGFGDRLRVAPAFPAPNTVAMLSLGSDVDGPVLQVRATDLTDAAYAFLLGYGTDYPNPVFTARMDSDGTLRYTHGASAAFADFTAWFGPDATGAKLEWATQSVKNMRLEGGTATDATLHLLKQPSNNSPLFSLEALAGNLTAQIFYNGGTPLADFNMLGGKLRLYGGAGGAASIFARTGVTMGGSGDKANGVANLSLVPEAAQTAELLDLSAAPSTLPLVKGVFSDQAGNILDIAGYFRVLVGATPYYVPVLNAAA